MITNETFSELFEKLQLSEKNTVYVQGPVTTEYNRKTFWDKIIVKEPVIAHNRQTIATATKNMIAGIVNKEDNTQIIDLVLKLAFYVVEGDNVCFVYENFLSFEDLNLSQKLFGANTRRKVTLVNNGWFENWSKFPNSVNESELELMEYLQQSSNDECISYWGPWLATIILSLENETVANASKRIKTLFSKLYRQYRGLGFDFPRIHQPYWEELLKNIEIVDLDEPKKNTLYWAMINVYHNPGVTKIVTDFLNLTIIPSLRFKNMELITLIDQFRKMVGCGQSLALVASLSASTLRAWEHYVKMTETYLDPKHPLGKDEFWPYAREFDSTVFVDMSYEENYRLCNVLAMIIDLSESPLYSYQGSNIGPTYAKLISKKLIKELDKDDFEHCKKVYGCIRKKELEIGVNVSLTNNANMLTG